MARVRSPNYPSISLPDAIERVRKIYKSEHMHKAPPEVVAKILGYNGLNGASLMVLSTLKKYGLLEEVGRDLKVSQDALVILVDPENSQERVAAIRKAARAPALFEKFFDEYGDKAPSDENIRAYLLKNGFAQTAVDTPIRCYRETLDFVSRLGPYNRSEQPNQEAETTMEATEERDVRSARTATNDTPAATAGMKRDVWDLDEGRVVLERPAELGPESLEYLEAWLFLLLKKIKKESVKTVSVKQQELDDLVDKS